MSNLRLEKVFLCLLRMKKNMKTQWNRQAVSRKKEAFLHDLFEFQFFIFLLQRQYHW